ncbi:putative MFS family arabinose efflux permease [Nocardia sp. GAS34]|uniref:MFS transporter n=1 Tax=unclassified Nocardia TaxID=2637762 RepID=UPI003D2195C5
MTALHTSVQGTPTVPVQLPRAATPTWWVWLAAWPVMAVFVLSNAATPLYVVWQREIGFSKGTMTVVFACYIVGLLGSLLVSGVTSDRLGRRAVLLPAIVVAIIACLTFAMATNVAMLMIARLFTGIAVGAAVSAGMAAVTDVAGPQRKPLAALLASCAMVFGAGTGPLLAGILSETLPAPTVTVFGVEIALLVTAALVVVRMPVTRPAAGGTRSWIRVPGVPSGQRGRLVLGIAVFAPGITATSFVLSLGPALLSGLLGTSSPIMAGAMAFGMFVTATAVQFAVRALPQRTIMIASAAATTLAMITLIVAITVGSIPGLLASALLAGSGQGLGQLGGLSLLNTAIPTRRLAEANAAFNIGGYIPAGLLPVIAGYLSDAAGLPAAATTFALVLMTSAVIGGLAIAKLTPTSTDRRSTANS